jgi:hypothetical protein
MSFSSSGENIFLSESILNLLRQSMPIKFAWSHQCQLEITSVVALVERILKDKLKCMKPQVYLMRSNPTLHAPFHICNKIRNKIPAL